MDLVKDQPEKLIEAALTELELIGAEIKIFRGLPDLCFVHTLKS